MQMGKHKLIYLDMKKQKDITTDTTGIQRVRLECTEIKCVLHINISEYIFILLNNIHIYYKSWGKRM